MIKMPKLCHFFTSRIAEVYPTEEPKPVFTTTINFYSEGAATKVSDVRT